MNYKVKKAWVESIFFVFFFWFLACNMVFAAPNPPAPVIFVHGIGDSSVAWKVTGPKVSAYYDKYYKSASHPCFQAGAGIGKNRDDKNFDDNIRNSCVYVTFKDYYASPETQVKELEQVIVGTRKETYSNFPSYFKSSEEVKINLVAHSMGGLVCRDYIIKHPKDHHVDAFIAMSCPNLGVPELDLKWTPYLLDAGGIAGAIVFANPLFLGFSAVGVGADMILHSSGIRLLSPAADSLQVGSSFLMQVNKCPLPEDIKYSFIISKATDPMSKALNSIFGFKNGGDGTLAVESQSLKYAGIPNFKKINYQEYYIDSPHFQVFNKSGEDIIEILGLR